MWKVVCAAVAILVVPIFCGPIEGTQKKIAFQKILEDVWSEKCRNVSGVTVDFNRNEHLYADYISCTVTAITKDDMRKDIASIFPELDLSKMDDFLVSNQQKIDLAAMTRKYCPKVDAFLGCKDILCPIHSECYDDEELKGQSVERAIYQTLNHYFCRNESDEVKRLLDGKVIECAMEKRDEILECYNVFAISFLNMSMPASIFSMLPKSDHLRRSIESLGQCLVPLFDQCTFSQSVGNMVSSLFREIEVKVFTTEILTETACVRHINAIK
ncbi:uncharacterized protein LOC119071005 [Bradysia coprophila]|uniref:uncharacterized protein LOC119071005 n=1 Tax=Bradysia coprophila TaxID=38358 RepID=UPI00187DC290|nr:uncharacterized protein LOC119071005 [Bradysia coprophila]